MKRSKKPGTHENRNERHTIHKQKCSEETRPGNLPEYSSWVYPRKFRFFGRSQCSRGRTRSGKNPLRAVQGENIVKCFMLFAGDRYYPSPGMQDFIDSFDTLDEAKNHAIGLKSDWVQIFDVENNKIVFENYYGEPRTKLVRGKTL